MPAKSFVAYSIAFCNKSYSLKWDKFVRIENFIPHCAFYANKDIKKGEELTFCYSSYFNDNIKDNKSLSYKKCECGSLLCKGYIPN